MVMIVDDPDAALHERSRPALPSFGPSAIDTVAHRRIVDPFGH